MVTLADSLISSSSRPLLLRMRPDLFARRHRYEGRPFWVVKEPVGQKYFRFQEEEYAILCMLDGRSSLDEIKERFEREFVPRKITFTDLQQFIGTLHRSGLLIGDAPGQGQQLKLRGDKQRRQKLIGSLSNVFALRWKGIDPERLLNWLYRYTWWMFTPTAVTICCLLGLAALTLVIVQFDVFRARLPAFHEFFGPKNWIYLGISMAVVKVLHEFGHGLSCKHFGGECHEMGFMLLIFTPALYCNVSDSWLLDNKYKRMAIGAAGMYVELTLASIATFLWWFSEPGLLNHICLSVMFVCSVSTVMFNGNPLLRFDGYYILADFVEIPNLRQKATTVLRRLAFHYCLGLEQPEDPFLPKRNQFFLALYTVAAVSYRWLITLSILMFFNKLLEPYGLKIVGQAIALVGLFGLVIQPLWQLGQFFYVPGRIHQVKRKNVLASLGVVAAVVLAVALVPLPHHVNCSFEIAPRDAASVYADTPGKLTEVSVKEGEHVLQAQPLARLENVDLNLALIELTGRHDEYQAQLTSLRRERFRDPRAGRQIPEVEKTLAMIKEQLTEKEHQAQRLNLTAPVEGVVLPPPARPSHGGDSERLERWSGSPLETKNHGAHLAEGELLCRIGDPHKLDALLVVDQTDIELVQVGQVVKIQLAARPGKTYSGRLEEIARLEMKESPLSLSNKAGGELATKTDAEGAQRPLSTSYQARLPLDDPEGRLQIGLSGQAKIYTPWRSLGSRLWRYLAQTFHFNM